MRSLEERVAALSARQQQALADLVAREGSGGTPDRLVAFVVADPAATPSDEELRTFLAERLPAYMIPSRFEVVGQLPRTSAGKLDRKALAALRGTAIRTAQPERRGAEPLTDVQAKLVAVFRDVLNMDDIGIDDDFFEIGGDSLLSIRVIARAGRAGMSIPPERFFERPTVRHLARVIDGGTASANNAGHPDAPAQSSLAPLAAESIGEAPLTPIQHWFLGAIPEHRDWWNQAYLLDVGHPLAAETLRDIVGFLVRHHDALRVRLDLRDGTWRQIFPATDAGFDAPFRVVTLDGNDQARHAARMVQEGEREHASLRLQEGRLFRAVLFDDAAGFRRLLLVAHHLVVDGVSWSVILEDLAQLVTQAASGEALQLPPASVSARSWAMRLDTLAATPEVTAAAPFWLSMPADDGAMPRVVTPNADASVVTVTLNADDTARLVQDAARRLGAPVQALLLAALLIAWQRWTRRTRMRLDLEGHGRDALGESIDSSRTVGWFTTVFPVHLTIPTDRAGTADPAAIVAQVQQTLESLPMRGASHGLLRHLTPDHGVRASLAAAPRPSLLFNYLGVHEVVLPPASGLRVAGESAGRSRDPRAERPYLLELNARVHNGMLVVSIEHATSVHPTRDVEQFASALRDALLDVAGALPARLVRAGFDAATLATVADLLGDLDEPNDSDES